MRKVKPFFCFLLTVLVPLSLGYVSMFVTDVKGTSGSRTAANIFVAANTSPTISAKMPLAQYITLPANYFAAVRITYGYYKVAGAVTPTLPELGE